jgi:hypothetical protein
VSPPDWTASGHFVRGRFCPEHGYPLRAWHRVGKLECPVRWCPYVEPQEDGLETVELSFSVPEWACERADEAAMAECECPDHQAARRVLDLMERRRWDLLPPAAPSEAADASPDAGCCITCRHWRVFPASADFRSGASPWSESHRSPESNKRFLGLCDAVASDAAVGLDSGIFQDLAIVDGILGHGALRTAATFSCMLHDARSESEPLAPIAEKAP